MGQDETPFRLELKDPRCGSQIKHKSNPNYEQVLFIKSHYGALAGSASDSCQEEAAVLGSLPSPGCLTFYCCLHTSLQGATWIFFFFLIFQCFYSKLLLYNLSAVSRKSQEVWRCFPELQDETWHFVITLPGGIYVFIL